MSRSFSSAARALYRFVWGRASRDETYEAQLKNALSKNSKLKDSDEIRFHGGEHVSKADPNLRVSGEIFKNDKRQTSVHAYKDGRVEYSQAEFNKAQEK